MSQHPEVMQSCIDVISELGTGSGGTRNISGTSSYHVGLEKCLAELHNKDRALVFPSAYTANQSTISILCKNIEGIEIFSDELNHASLIEGIRNSNAKYHIFKHNNIDDLEKEFEKNTNLMLDSFTFSVVIPGNLRNTNATLISALDKTVYWEFNFNDIATNHFNMYAHSIVINNLALQLFLLIILLVFAGFIWKKRLKK